MIAYQKKGLFCQVDSERKGLLTFYGVLYPIFLSHIFLTNDQYNFFLHSSQSIRSPLFYFKTRKSWSGAFQILNEAMKGMKHVVIYLTTYSFHGFQKFTNSCNWQCSQLFIACQINLNQITCNLSFFLSLFTSKHWL
jgi:hypothetical protein